MLKNFFYQLPAWSYNRPPLFCPLCNESCHEFLHWLVEDFANATRNSYKVIIFIKYYNNNKVLFHNVINHEFILTTR